jgi:hypothetical protein
MKTIVCREEILNNYPSKPTFQARKRENYKEYKNQLRRWMMESTDVIQTEE